MVAPATFNTPDRIIRMAMSDAGLLQEGDDPTPEQYANNLNRLNDMINFWQTQGLKMWLQSDLTVPLVAGQRTYNIGPSGHVVMSKPLRVLDSSYYLDSSNNQRPLTMLSRDDYAKLSTVFQQGAINSYFVDKQVAQLAVSMWLVPDTQAATGTVHLIVQGQVENLVSLTDTLNFPKEWFMALRWGLADDICSGQPQALMDRCQQRALAYRVVIEDWDVEDASTRFTPDTSRSQHGGAFR